MIWSAHCSSRSFVIEPWTIRVSIEFESIMLSRSTLFDGMFIHLDYRNNAQELHRVLQVLDYSVRMQFIFIALLLMARKYKAWTDDRIITFPLYTKHVPLLIVTEPFTFVDSERRFWRKCIGSPDGPNVSNFVCWSICAEHIVRFNLWYYEWS